MTRQKAGKIAIPRAIEILKEHGCRYDHENGGILSKNGKKKGHMATNGYRIVGIQHKNVMYYICEHRIVWWWFHPETPENMVIDHLNCRRDDNRIENLEAVTPKENINRTFERGRDNVCRGEQNGRTKLTNREAMAIRYMAQAGYPRKDISSIIVGKKSEHPMVTVNRVINRTRFGHLQDPADIWDVYPTIVAATARTDLPENEQISNAVMGMAGELGEVVDMIKKHLYQGHELDEDALKEELGDLLFYITWLSVLVMGFDRAEILLRNADKLRSRYPNGFDPERSLHREETP